MRFLLTGAVIGVGAAAPSTASAASSTVSLANGSLTVTAAARAANDITVDGFDAGNYNVTDESPSTGAGCTQQSATSVFCPKAGTVRILVAAGDLNDKVTINGGLGADRFRGHAGNDLFSARDYVRGSYFQCDEGVDTIYADRLDPGLYMIGCERVLRPPAPRK